MSHTVFALHRDGFSMTQSNIVLLSVLPPGGSVTLNVDLCSAWRDL